MTSENSHAYPHYQQASPNASPNKSNGSESAFPERNAQAAAHPFHRDQKEAFSDSSSAETNPVNASTASNGLSHAPLSQIQITTEKRRTRKNSSITTKKPVNSPGDSPHHASSTPRNLCKFDANCKDAFCLSRHTNRAVCPNLACQHPSCSLYHQNKLRCALDLRCNNQHCDKRHSVSVLKLQLRHVRDEMEFWMRRDPHNASRWILDNLIEELVRMIRVELHFDLDPKLHFPHLYNKDSNQFLSGTFGTTDSQCIYLCGLRGQQKRDVENFFQRGVHLTGTKGLIFLEPTPAAVDNDDDDTEENNYVASFVVPFRFNYLDNALQCLLSMQWQQKSKNYLWSFLGGYRLINDKDAVETALRELDHETMGEFPRHLLEKLEGLMRGDDYSFRYKHHGTFYYFIPDFLIPDRLLDRISQRVQELPSKQQTIKQWKAKYGADRQAFERAIQEGGVTFAFDVGKKFRWMTHKEARKADAAALKHQSSTDYDTVPDDCPCMKNVEAVLSKFAHGQNKRRLKQLWANARETKYGLIDSPSTGEIDNLPDQSVMSEISEMPSDDEGAHLDRLRGMTGGNARGGSTAKASPFSLSFWLPKSLVPRVMVGVVSVLPMAVLGWWIYVKREHRDALTAAT